MAQNRIANTWREHVVNKLQDRYGLTAEQAQWRADVWLQWIREQPRLAAADFGVAEAREKSSPSRPFRSSKSRSAAGTSY